VTDARVPSASPRLAVAQTLRRQQRPERARCRVRPRAKVKHRPMQERYLTEPLSAGGVHVGRRAAERCGPVPPGATPDTAFTYTGLSGTADTPRHGVRPHRGPPAACRPRLSRRKKRGRCIPRHRLAPPRTDALKALLRQGAGQALVRATGPRLRASAARTSCPRSSSGGIARSRGRGGTERRSRP
jgi:hypothetical protein